MTSSIYLFVFYVFALLCIFALICKCLFAKSRKNLLSLAEKEKKLLALYSTMEELIDDFNSSTEASKRELDSRIREIRELAINSKTQVENNLALFQQANLELKHEMSLKKQQKQQKIALAKEEEPVKAPNFPKISSVPEISSTNRSAMIVNLHDDGFDRLQIAKELAVTVNEVDLVLGIAAKGR